MDPDPEIDRNESTNVPISKLRIETKPKRFDVFQNLKWNVSVYSKNCGTNQNFLMCSNFFFAKANCFYFFQKFLNKTKTFDVFQLFFRKSKILDLKENVLVR